MKRKRLCTLFLLVVVSSAHPVLSWAGPAAQRGDKLSKQRYIETLPNSRQYPKAYSGARDARDGRVFCHLQMSSPQAVLGARIYPSPGEPCEVEMLVGIGNGGSNPQYAGFSIVPHGDRAGVVVRYSRASKGSTIGRVLWTDWKRVPVNGVPVPAAGRIRLGVVPDVSYHFADCIRFRYVVPKTAAPGTDIAIGWTVRPSSGGAGVTPESWTICVRDRRPTPDELRPPGWDP